MNEIYITFGAYIVIVFTIGIYASRATKNLSDYILAGRDLPGPVVALGAGASDMSSWLLMALPGAVFVHGMDQIWLPIGLSLGAYLNWQFVARRLRVYTEVAKDSLTIPAYFDNRFQDDTRILRIITAIVVLIFFTFYASAGFVAAGYLVQQLTSIPYFYALLLGALVIIIYICIGGFFAVSWIDFFQGSLMFFALLAVPVVAIHHLGGWHAMMDMFSPHVDMIKNIKLSTVASHKDLVHIQESLAKFSSSYLSAFENIHFIGVISLLAWGLGYFGQPQIIVRFMAARSHHDIPFAQLICVAWMIIALYCAVLTGLVGHALYPNGLQHPEVILIVIAKTLFTPWIAGIILAGVLSAAMSATSAQLLASASAATEDIYHIIRKKRPQKELVWVARCSVLLIGFIAIWLAARPTGTIFQLVGYAWAGLGSAFGPVVLISLYWKRMTRNAAILGMISGAVVMILWEILSQHFGGIFKVYSLVPGFMANAVIIYVVSMLDVKPNASVLNEFDKTVLLLKK